MQWKKLIRGLSSQIAVLLWASAAWCGTFTVNPVRIQVSASRPNAMLQITNRDDQQVTLQIHVVTWSFDGQKDVYVDSDDVMLNPPIAVIAPNQTQLIRLALRHQNDGAQERSYRLIVEEVPMPPKPGFRGVQTVVRVSIPIFAAPKASISPRLNWQIVRMSDARLKLIATNRGSAHIQIKSLNVTGADSPQGFLKGTPAIYLLPNQQREWLIDDQRAQGTSRIKVLAVTDAGELNEVLEVQHP
ncbi:MAG: fimbria/pilus periplasmic chaperone [Acidobacteriia bacterium]|nr:fimbria/pilus periplasmic chaperone [Terriglobia bacterium]